LLRSFQRHSLPLEVILDAEPLEQENGLVVDDPRSTDRDETPISPSMGRSVIGLCGGFAMVVGGYDRRKLPLDRVGRLSCFKGCCASSG